MPSFLTLFRKRVKNGQILKKNLRHLIIVMLRGS